MRNVTGPPVMGDDLYGRQQDIDRLWSRLEGGEHLLMLAPRRVGKTSLMADGYLVRSGDRVAFRSNLLRVWWRKHRAAAS